MTPEDEEFKCLAIGHRGVQVFAVDRQPCHRTSRVTETEQLLREWLVQHHEDLWLECYVFWRVDRVANGILQYL